MSTPRHISEKANREVDRVIDEAQSKEYEGVAAPLEPSRQEFVADLHGQIAVDRYHEIQDLKREAAAVSKKMERERDAAVVTLRAMCGDNWQTIGRNFAEALANIEAREARILELEKEIVPLEPSAEKFEKANEQAGSLNRYDFAEAYAAAVSKKLQESVDQLCGDVKAIQKDYTNEKKRAENLQEENNSLRTMRLNELFDEQEKVKSAESRILELEKEIAVLKGD